MVKEKITFEDLDFVIAIIGKNDENIKIIEKELGVKVVYRDGEIRISGDEQNVRTGVQVINLMKSYLEKGVAIESQTVRYCITLATNGNQDDVQELTGDFVCVTASGKPVRPKTLGQKAYLTAIEKNSIVFGIGPAGTGKTYLAVATAVKAFKAHQISKIILTRPAVEAGEKLGFLPGDLQDKVDPYLRPLYDALFDMLGAETFQKLSEKGLIEVAPLAYMRGRTLDDAFIILDEAQNTTKEQMKMFLTRMGVKSKVIITGDLTQIDLPRSMKSGLLDAVEVLVDIEDIAFIKFTEKDVVRHRLVQQIIIAYEKSKTTEV